jgi:membrane associated rhomboid family serine protease
LPDLTTLPEGVQVAWQAHAIGAILGLLSAIYESMRPGAHCVA